MSRPLKVSGLIADDGACGMYRVSMPLQKAHDNRYFQTHLCGYGKSGDILSSMLEADIVLIPRVGSEANVKVVKLLKEGKKIVVTDFDDDIFNVSPLSQHYQRYGTRDVEIQVDGKKAMLWESGRENNGQTFDIEENLKLIETAKECISLCDCVTVTTDELASVYRRYNRNVVVLPNFIDIGLWNKVDVVKNSKVNIMWHGGASHYDDWLTIANELVDVVGGRNDAHLILCGVEFPGLIKKIRHRYTFYPWVPITAHPYRQASLGADIGIIPLKMNDFGRSKSPIKWIEYSAMELPTLAIDFPPYNKVIEDGVTGLLYKDGAEFKEKLNLLINEKDLRERLGKNARKKVEEEFDINDQCWRWAALYKGLFDDAQNNSRPDTEGVGAVG